MYSIYSHPLNLPKMATTIPRTPIVKIVFCVVLSFFILIDFEIVATIYRIILTRREMINFASAIMIVRF